MEDYLNDILAYLPKLLIALILLTVGMWVLRRVQKILERILSKGKLDVSLYGFLVSVLSFTLRVILIITVASTLGVPMTTFITMLGAASLAVGFALRDSIANVAGGIIILSFKLFTVGDFIELDGSIGTVKEIELLYSSFNTPDNKRIYMPNGEIIRKKLINFSKEPTRRVDIIFGASYNDDIEKVKSIIMNIAENNQYILKEPAPLVRVIKHGESSIDYIVKAWCLKDDYWNVHHDLHEDVKKEFDKNDVEIPFPQRSLHIKQE